MKVLASIDSCEKCPHRETHTSGDGKHARHIKDRWGNEVIVAPEEHIQFCKHMDRIIFDDELHENIAMWCRLPTVQYFKDTVKELLLFKENQQKVPPKYWRPSCYEYYDSYNIIDKNCTNAGMISVDGQDWEYVERCKTCPYRTMEGETEPVRGFDFE